jgi:hypothetical protein
MTEAQRHILERHLEAARTQRGMTAEQSWELLERKLDEGPSPASMPMRRATIAIIAAVALLLAVAYLLVTKSDAPNAATPRERSAPSTPRSQSSVARPDEDSVSVRTEARPSVISPSSDDVPPTPRAHRLSSAKTPKETLPPLIVDSVDDPDSAISRAAEAFWNGRLDSYLRAFDAMVDPIERDTLRRARMRFEYIGQQIRVAMRRSQAFDTAAAHNGIVAIYTSLNDISQRYPQLTDDYRDTLAADFRAYVDTLHAVASRQPQSEGNDTLLARIDRARVVFDAVLANDDQTRMMYGMGMLPTMLLYHGEELSSVLDKFQTTMALFLEMADPRELIGFGALPERGIISTVTLERTPASATLELSLPRPAAHLSIRIVDASGAVVAVHDRGARSAGTHREVIDISRIPRGDYLCVVDAGFGEIPAIYTTLFSIVR